MIWADVNDIDEGEAIRRIRTEAYLAKCRVWGKRPTVEGCRAYVLDPTEVNKQPRKGHHAEENEGSGEG